MLFFAFGAKRHGTEKSPPIDNRDLIFIDIYTNRSQAAINEKG